MQRILFVLLGLSLAACATTPAQDPVTPPDPIVEPAPEEPVSNPEPDPVIEDPSPEPEIPPEPETAEPLPMDPDPVIAPDPPSKLSSLTGWASADVTAALSAFKRGCSVWSKRDPQKQLHATRPSFGTYSDWQPVCAQANTVSNPDENTARTFFETWFAPVTISTTGAENGLMTGYYQPEVDARTSPNKEFREPILAVPTQAANRTRPRSEITAASARVIAYGRPIDVFFMQIQGSGILVFPDGQRLRAAYAGNNGYAYTSIGRILVERGELTKTDASKQSIEAWMKAAGPLKSRALMNENKRYIFFKEDQIVPGEGPLGAMRVPLTAMGSVAIDKRFYPYGVPVWIETKLPSSGGDYRGRSSALLLITQDTGQAIRGEERGDIYFGSGFAAGDKAGVMKHPGSWTLLLPKHMVPTDNRS